MEKLRLGEVLIREKLIDEATLKKALELQRNTQPHRMLGQIMVQMKAIAYSQLLITLTQDLHIPRAKVLLDDRQQIKLRLGLVSPENTSPPDSEASEPSDKSEMVNKTAEIKKTEKRVNPARKPVKDMRELQLSRIEIPIINIDTLKMLPDAKGDLQQVLIMVREMLSNEHYEEAEFMVDEGIELVPDSIQLKWLRLYIYCIRHFMQKARAYIEKMDHTDLQHPAIRAVHAYILMEQNKFEEATKVLSVLLTQEKKDKLWLFWQGYAQAHSGHIIDAVASYQKYLKMENDTNRLTQFARRQLQELTS